MGKVFTISEGLENLGAMRTGGQGSVYKGRRTGTIYSAIKLLPTPILTEDENNKNYINFQNEVAKLQKVNEQPNPHVVKILSWGLTDSSSFPFIEMEYIEGPDLCDLLNQPHEPVFTLKELIKVADQLAGALAHCHRVGVKHGDIKSNNVKYNVHTGNYVLLDFGLAVLTDEQRRSSMRNAGAIEFMAPEQHEGYMLPQTDVYSYGVVLYELLTGQVPFPLNGNGETARNSVMLAHLESAVSDPLMKRGLNMPADWSVEKKAHEMQVPEWLLEVISKCLEKDPQKRYANGIELQEAVVNGTLQVTESRYTKQQEVLSTSALQTENERLQAQLLQHQQAEDEVQKKLSSLQSIALEAGGVYNPNKGVYERNKAIVFLPKRLFLGIAGAGLLFMLLFVFSFFNKNEGNDTNVALTKPYRSPYIYFKKPYNYDSVARARAAAIVKPKEPGVYKQPIVKAKKWQKKKRKKFLGIF
ncbi:serine/threonine-protein kinase [Mucilaginibacter sp. PAMB04168]|uniref:serine/threonine protein kinase n=1 Tax=Mucilaginibacter sp. PAMB04168 TaxID=3138567 RepID=UPI0031F6A510